MKLNPSICGILLLCFISHAARVKESIVSFQKCNLYSFDQCLINGKDVIEEVHNTSPDQCQFFCSNIYKDSCSFFMLKEDSHDCLLFNVTLNSFLLNCEEIGGPLEPSIKECIEMNDPCESFVEAACFYYGQIIQILHNIDSIDACQEACQYYPPCQYFTYSKTNEICDLLSSPDRLCDHFIGTPTPNIENCVASTIPTTMSKSTTTIEIKDLSGCSALNAMHCQSNPSMIVREIEDISDTQVCQFMCNTVYGSVCKYFIHDLTMSTCIIINTEDIDNCDKVASGVITNIEECDPIFHSEDEDRSCLNFREHLCRYEGRTLIILQHVSNAEACQLKCKNHSECQFFVYDSDTEECELLDSGKRRCEMVRGTPSPDFEKCKQDGNIHWP